MPKVVDHDMRRAEMVQATWHVIAEEGLQAATVRRIAEAADCTTGRITHYFETKDEVLVAALRAVHRAAATRMIVHIAGDDPRKALRSVLLEALPLDEERQLEWRVWLAFWGRAATDAELRLEQERRYAEWRALLDQLLQRAHPQQSTSDRRTSVDVVASGIDGLGIQAVLEPEAFAPHRLRRSVDLLITAAMV